MEDIVTNFIYIFSDELWELLKIVAKLYKNVRPFRNRGQKRHMI
jgi:hypothetical protein